MTKKTRFGTLLILGLLVLAFSTAAVWQTLAQETETGGASPSSVSIESSAALAQPDLDWTSSSEPGYVAPQGQPAEPEDEINAVRSLRVNGSSLRPRDGDVVWESSGTGGCAYMSSGNTLTVWNTPVYLPQGSTVSQMRMYVNDTSPTHCWSWFTVYDLYGNIVIEWGVRSDTTAGESWWYKDIPDHVIDYNTYSYALNWRPYEAGSDMQLCGFRLIYTPPPGLAFAPAVMRNH